MSGSDASSETMPLSSATSSSLSRSVSSIEPLASMESSVPSAAWEVLLAPAAVLCALVGALAFGAPSLLLGAGVITFAARRDGRHRNDIALLAAASVCLIGFVGGVAFSWYWWVRK